jgi:O-6-methylguanine DNA methyltransferase
MKGQKIQELAPDELINLHEAMGRPSDAALRASQMRVLAMLKQEATVITWDMFESPVGPFYVGATAAGVCSIMFGCSESEFLDGLGPKTFTRHDSAAMAGITAQFRAYFEKPRITFDLPIDLSRTTHFQRKALELVRTIPPGSVWTYKQVAAALGRPRSSRAVGQAMAHNPVPILIPCHRVVGSSGALTGYGGGGGIATKRRLLQMEGAL